VLWLVALIDHARLLLAWLGYHHAVRPWLARLTCVAMLLVSSQLALLACSYYFQAQYLLG
jgi:hypothetical protein